MNQIKIDGATGVVNTPVIRDAASSYANAIPPAEAHARVLARQAERWIAFAGERTRMTPRVITAKALDSLAFSVHRGARSLAVPSKLSGTREHQRRLWTLVREGYRPFETLTLDTLTTDGVAFRLGDEPLGIVQPKHAWIRPLIPFGARLYLERVTGSERDGYTLGLNVVFGGVGQALDRLLDALGASLPPAGHPVGTRAGSGDGALPEATQTVVVPAMPPAPTGDGASTPTPALRLVVPAEHEHPVPDAADVVLWRGIDGMARASVTHVVRHSPSGVEWGYGGSGPSDLARSVLLALTDEATADRHYVAFKEQVIARVPVAGGVLRAADVRRWLDRQQTPSA